MEYHFKNAIVYFDSYKVETIKSTIEKYFKKYRKILLRSNIQLRHLFSSHWEFFCISFILCVENNIPIQKFLKMFHKKHLYLNDYISIKIYNTFNEYTYLSNWFDFFIDIFHKYDHESLK